MSTLTDVYATRIAKKSYTTLMKNGRFMAALNRAERLKGDRIHALPPGSPIPVYPVDSLPGCPEDWVRGQGSYVCPVSPDWGLWFDWTMNDRLNTGILPSVKGANPITGQKIDGLGMHQYKEKCPIHDIAFKGGDRFCEKCNYQWPGQDYVSAPNTLWWDGFRQPDGTVRQFFFSADEEKDVASALIGAQNTVPAFGFAFYEPKVRREEPRMYRTRSMSAYSGPQWSADASFGAKVGASMKDATKGILKSYQSDVYKGGAPGASAGASSYDTDNDSEGFVEHSDSLMCLCSNSSETMPEKTYFSTTAMNEPPPMAKADVPRMSMSRGITAQSVMPPNMDNLRAKVAVGAGARIAQALHDDTLGIDDWKTEPSAVVRLYFVFRPKFEEIFEKGGILDLEGDKEGFLKGLSVG